MGVVHTLLYGCVLVTCAGLLGLQCHQLAVLFASEPTVLIRRTEPANTMSIPGMTICPSSRMRADVLADWGLLQEDGRGPVWSRFPENASLDQLWMEAAVDLNQLVEDCVGGLCGTQEPRGGLLPNGKGYWVAISNERGVCYTLRLSEKMDMLKGIFRLSFKHSALHAPVGEAADVHVFLHGEKTPVVEGRSLLSAVGIIASHPHIAVRPGDMLVVGVSLSLEVSPSLRRQQCVSEREYSRDFCRQQCVRRLQTMALGCRAPWMPGPTEQACSTQREVYLAMDIGQPIFPSAIRKHCNCHVSCTQERWTARELTRDVHPFYLGYNMSSLTLRWAERASVTTEVLTYGTSSLLSDIAGIIGILFGASVLGVVQMTEDCLKKTLDSRRWRGALKLTSQKKEQAVEAWGSHVVTKRNDGAGELDVEKQGLEKLEALN